MGPMGIMGEKMTGTEWIFQQVCAYSRKLQRELEEFELAVDKLYPPEARVIHKRDNVVPFPKTTAGNP